MKPPLVLSTLIGGMVVVGAAAVGTAYLGRHPARPQAPQAATQAAPPLAAPPTVAPPSVADGSPPPRTAWRTPRRMRIHASRRACPVPVVYPAHGLHRPGPQRWSVARTVYGPPPAYALAPPHRVWYGRPDWRVGWREPRWHGPGWPYEPRWGYGPRPGYGPPPGYGWRSW